MMFARRRRVPAPHFTFVAFLAIYALGVGRATAQSIATETIDASTADPAPEGLSTSDWSSIRAAYEAGRHAAFAEGGGYQARNPGQQWRTRFDGHGFLTTPDAGGWSWGLELVSYGRAGAQHVVTAPSRARHQAGCVQTRVEADGGRVSYHWDEILTEWYINNQRGLEHGYTVHRRPQSSDPNCDRQRAASVSDQSPDRQGGVGVSDQSPDRKGGVGSRSRRPIHSDSNRFLTVAALNDAHQRESDAPLQLTLAVRGDLRPRVDAGGRNVTFVNDAGAAVVNYFGLSVLDAGGEALPARFEASGEALVLNIDDRGARYPLTIDPIAQQAYLKASNTDSSDFFGGSVAVSGDTVVVGADSEDSNATGVDGNPLNSNAPASGAAYVFVRGAGGIWSQQAYLKASNTESSDGFGHSVAVSGDTVVVGAACEDSNATGVNAPLTGGSGTQSDNSVSCSGAAYVFVRDAGGVWSQQAYLKASNTDSSDFFGISVAVSGDTVVVGARSEASNATGVNAPLTGGSGTQSDNSADGSGAAYVFVRDAGGVWSQQAYLKASNTDALDQFGLSVAASGDTVVIGAHLEDSSATEVDGNQGDNSADAAGAAYVFVRAAGGGWSQQAYLKASNTDSGDAFGLGVAASGDTVVVGARLEDSSATGVDGNQADNSADGSGAAYVFVRDAGGVWSQQGYLKASNSDSGDEFGRSVAASGDTVVVGAAGESSSATGVDGNQADNSAGGSGAAYVFVKGAGGGWNQQAYLKASNTDSGDSFGESVAASGITVVVGALAEDSNVGAVDGNQADNSASNAGAAYVLLLPDCNANGINDATDIANGTSQDCNTNGIPDECELDTDNDGVIDDCDNCPNTANAVQVDADGDGVGDACDNCPGDPNKTAPGICGCGAAEGDTDGDGVPDCIDNCPNDPNKLTPGICGCGNPDSLDDTDGDGIVDCLDNCPTTANTDQADGDGNGVGDVCEPPAAGQATDACGCGSGMDGMMVMPMTLLGIGWMRRRTSRRHRDR